MPEHISLLALHWKKDVNKQLPGFSKIDPYRGLSCVLGNSLAQFLGGNGGASLPLYPVGKKK